MSPRAHTKGPRASAATHDLGVPPPPQVRSDESSPSIVRPPAVTTPGALSPELEEELRTQSERIGQLANAAGDVSQGQRPAAQMAQRAVQLAENVAQLVDGLRKALNEVRETAQDYEQAIDNLLNSDEMLRADVKADAQAVTQRLSGHTSLVNSVKALRASLLRCEESYAKIMDQLNSSSQQQEGLRHTTDASVAESERRAAGGRGYPPGACHPAVATSLTCR